MRRLRRSQRIDTEEINAMAAECLITLIPICNQAERMLSFLRYLASTSHLQDVHYLWRPFLRDPDDDMVLECAVASASRFIVTHNVKDFRRTRELGVTAVTPGEFLKQLECLP
jgi:predicted nucleic acid-binding protein